MNTPLVYTTILLLTINSSHVSGIPINRKFVNTKEIPKIDDILPSHILSRLKIPKKTVKDVLQKFVVGNIDLKNLYKLGDDVFEYFDGKTKLLDGASMKTKGANDSRHPFKRRKEHKHYEDRPAHIKEKRKETENGGRKTRTKKLKKKKKHKNARKTTKREKSTTKSFRTTATSSTANTTPLSPTTKMPPPYRHVPINTEGIRTATVTERKKTIPDDLNTHVSPLESSLITSLKNPIEPTTHSLSESYNWKGQPTPKSVKTIPGSESNVDDGYNASSIQISKHSSQSAHSTTSLSVPSYLSHSSTASSTWIHSLSSSAQFTSTSTRSTSSIHITSSLSSLSLFASLATSSMSKWKTSKLLSIPVSASSTHSPSSLSLHLLNTSMSEPFTSSISLSPLPMSSSFPSATSIPLITSSSKMLMSSAKFHLSSSTRPSSSSTKSSSTTTESLHVTTSSQIPTEKSSSSSSSSSLIP